ncbi:nuclear transport factor 2 family protein [Floridanema aerugineum]|uniref:Nuclear transport factor 2 family protein n=1 Tax=Floridaenema aerugineum BLCC-F46 TaxID=3153654 RepID=A0ABV4XBL6_9CYAN
MNVTQNPTQVAFEVRDRLEIADAVYRFVAGIDFSDEELFVSAFAPDAIVDVTSNNKMWGTDYPIFEGRDLIVQVFKNSVFSLDTTHAVSNPRTKINGDTATLHTITEAQHFPPGDRTRHCLIKSHYHVDLVRDRTRWVITRLTINSVWFTGDPKILIGE